VRTRIGIGIAVLLAFLLPTLATRAASAAPAGTGCVGLIVEAGSTPKTSCVPYKTGLTGAQLLQQTGHKLTYAKSGLLCQIDGYPAACKSDNTHYWSYYLRVPAAASAAWKYATQGPVTQKVKPGETDAFVYVNGKDRKPAAIAYATIAAAVTPSASATSTATSSSPTSAGPTTSSSTASSSSSSKSGSSHTGLIIGIVVVIVILGAGVGQLVMRRRRTS
jgi:cobalamin biosynthesis Mg chelatase CobN